MAETVQFGRYELVSLLGEGGMAKVYRAVLSGPMGFKKQVAIKRIDPKLTEDEKLVHALINEARLGGQLRHRNIVEIYEFNQVAGNYYLAMEYIDGWTLSRLVRESITLKQYIPRSVVIEIIIEVCRGLSHAHSLKDEGSGESLNLVHRDLKPENIMVGRDGEVKVMDFGIAKADSNPFHTTAVDTTKGTPVYMSPEQVQAHPLDCRSDIFSLGSIIYHLLTFDMAFGHSELLTTLHAVLNADITKALERTRKLAPEFESVIIQCLEKDPADRYQSARDLSAELKMMQKETEGPTLAEWIESLDGLPDPVLPGEFGDHIPTPLATGTLSLTNVEMLEDTDSVPQQEAQFAPGDLTNWFDEQFFDTGEPKSPPTDDVGLTRAQESVKNAKRKFPVAVAGSIIGIIILFIAIIFVITQDTKTDEIVPNATIATNANSDSAMNTAATSDLTPRPQVQVLEFPDEATPAIEELPTPEPVQVLERPTPKPAPEVTPTPEPIALVEKVQREGTAVLSSYPWSEVSVDGKSVGNTPQRSLKLSAGVHTVVFTCTVCDPQESITKSVTIVADGKITEIARFGQ